MKDDAIHSSLFPLPFFCCLQSCCKHCGLFRREVVQRNAPTDVERRETRVCYQVGRCGNAEQAEGQADEFRIESATIVTRPYAGKELVGAEGQRPNCVDLIHKNYDGARYTRKHSLLECSHKALHRAEMGVALPEVLQQGLQLELLGEHGK